MNGKSLSLKVMYWARNLRSRQMFKVLKKYCRGNVLDVGGWDFHLTASKWKLSFDSWTVLDNSKRGTGRIEDTRVRFVFADGCRMPFAADKFDVVLNVQVLEHVFEPMKMVAEIARVLKPGGRGIFLVPQTSNLHLAPRHYYNFTRFWIKEAMSRSGLRVLELRPLGGAWSTLASRMVFFFFQAFRLGRSSTPEVKRNVFYYLLFPFMVLYAVVNIPICMLLSLGDLREEANNHLVVVSKPRRIKARRAVKV